MRRHAGAELARVLVVGDRITERALCAGCCGTTAIEMPG